MMSEGGEMFKLTLRHRSGPNMPCLLRPVSDEPKRQKQNQRRMVRKVSVLFDMGHFAMQYVNTSVLLHSLLCLWLDTEGHGKNVTVALMAGCQGQTFHVRRDES
jgi:hypothetical protein